ncbi:unnamed protein product [Cylicocyclus nassatus]|uniref:Guanylate-kinase-associated protein n=1 Tax=Cylicocyclus nassatus TaxID=53992 RepID=A0AA36GU58_CYLNA|nr:unnamed protein product [Cylicocyclus nassatus]
MPVEERKARGSPVGNFFAKLGRRVRSKSPAVTRLVTTETPKGKDKRGGTIDVLCKDHELDGFEATQSPHRFGTIISRLSRRKSKKSEKEENHVLSPECETISVPQQNFGTPRPAISENDLRHVTLRRGTDLDLTPLAGVSQFMSEDNLASAECGTPAYRTPSYIRVSCALSGYTKTPRHLESSAARAMGRSLVERRLGLFDTSMSPRNDNNDKEPRFGRSPLAMGASLSTPSPVRALIGQFDRLQLCSKDKDDVEKENTEPIKHQNIQQTIVTQPAPTSIFISDYIEKPPLPVAKSPVPVAETPPEVKEKERIKAEEITCELQPSPTPPKKADMRTGEDFSQLLESVRSRLQASTNQVLAELEEIEGMPEEAATSIRMAAGKAQLLTRKKLSKFEELVKKNLNPVEGDPQPATLDDLEGYWALVEIELQDIDECFAKVDAYRKGGWQVREPEETEQTILAASNNNNNVPKKRMAPVRPAAPPVDPAEKAKQLEKQKAAAEMRRKALAEAKQRARAAQQAQKQQAEEKNSTDASPEVLMVL